MSAKQILLFGNPVLRNKSKAIGKFDDKISRLLDEMTEVLYAESGRAGLAAPQVGISRRVIVIDCGNGLIELVNPVVTESSGEQIREEACLSYPGRVGLVRRADRVRVRGFDRNGEEIQIEGSGFVAQCLQHEIDHLDGILYIDRIVDDNLFDEPTSRKVDIERAIRLSTPK